MFQTGQPDERCNGVARAYIAAAVLPEGREADARHVAAATCLQLDYLVNSDIDEFLDHVDEWKFKLHEKLKRMTPAQRKAFWNQIHEEARARGLPVVEPEKPAKRPTQRVRRTG